MTPILYAKTERFFTSNGLGRLAGCRRCEVAEERNGEYICQFEYPINGPLYDQIEEGGYIYTTHDESGKPQAFQIYRRSAPLEGFVTFDAWHISYQLNQVILKPFTAASCAAALAAMPANSINYNPWSFWTDKAVSAPFSVTTPKSVRSALGGSAGSILDVYGKGDFEFDMFNVRLYTNRGADRGASIRYGENLVSLDQQKDASNIYNAVIPYWTDNNGGNIVTVNYPVYANAQTLTEPLETNNYEIITTETLDPILISYPELFTIALDLSNEFEEQPTAAQLVAAAQAYIEASDNYELKENLTVDFVALWQTEEYKQYAALQRVYLCDTVHIFYEKLGINATAKVIKTVYDSLNERYSSIELGTPKTTLGQQITEQISGEFVKEYPTRSQMQAAIDRQTAMITGNNGGYHIQIMNEDGQPQEDLWMDTDDVNTAQNILRINRNGIGFSRTGINGPYFSAWTIDGSFNADFITAGTLNADRIGANSISVGKLTGSISTNGWVIDLDNGTLTIGDLSADRIKAGTIADDLTTPKNYWNLTTGHFVTTQGTIGPFTIDSIGLSYDTSTGATHLDNVGFLKTAYGAVDGINFTRGVFIQGEFISFVGKTNSSSPTDYNILGNLYTGINAAGEMSVYFDMDNNTYLKFGRLSTQGITPITVYHDTAFLGNITVNNHQVLEI